MSRRRRAADRVSHERWLVSYADFITLLFAFFVVLFASSQVDKRKVERIASSIQEAFQQMGVFQAANSRAPMVTANPLPVEDVQAIEDGTGTDGHSASASAGMEGLKALQHQLESAVAREIQKGSVALKLTHEGLVISLREIGFYDSGSAELRPDSEETVHRIAAVLHDQPNNLRVEGHTDIVPIHNAHFASNWELSTARATEMIRLLITRYNFSAARLSAAGYGEYHPVASNDTAEGRGQNRRVDIVVLPSMPGAAHSVPN